MALIRTKTHSFHPKTAAAVHHLEKVVVLLAAEPAEACDFKVGPEMTHVVLLALHGLWVDVG
jgi:hypothetical protein